MADFNFVSERVATGAAVNNEADVQQLVTAGITHVIDCRGEYDDMPLFVSHPSISYLYNGTADDGQHKDTTWFLKSIEFALGAINHSNTKVYAHCAAGVNRGPSTAYAILRALGYTSALAESEIRKARPQVGIAYKQDADDAIKTLGY